jgi:hypothetical protein
MTGQQYEFQLWLGSMVCGGDTRTAGCSKQGVVASGFWLLWRYVGDAASSGECRTSGMVSTVCSSRAAAVPHKNLRIGLGGIPHVTKHSPTASQFHMSATAPITCFIPWLSVSLARFG